MTVIATNTVRPPQGKVTGENMSSMVIAYGATSLEASGIAFDEMGMTEEFQALVGKAVEVGEVHFGWMTVPADY